MTHGWRCPTGDQLIRWSVTKGLVRDNDFLAAKSVMVVARIRNAVHRAGQRANGHHVADGPNRLFQQDESGPKRSWQRFPETEASPHAERAANQPLELSQS